MEEETIKNLTQNDVLELIKDFPVKPLRNRVIITTNTEEIEEDEVDYTGSAFSPVQYVLAVGSYNEDVFKPGQKVHLDLESMTVNNPNREDVYNPVQQIKIKPVEVGDKFYGMITDDKIDFIYNG